MKKIKIYMDMCIYNRPFDDQRQHRINTETQIFIILMSMILEGRLELVNSFALQYENSKNTKIENMLRISDILEYSKNYISYDKWILERSIQLEKYGLKGMDAIHIACAEKAKADFFITCDDGLIKKLEKIDKIGVAYYNIIDFVSKEVFKI